MKNSIVKRSTSVLLALIVGMMFTLSATQEVNAASTKNFQVTSQINTTWTSKSTYDGNTYKHSGKNKTTYVYNKDGLNTAIKHDDGKTTFKRNKKGYTTQYKHYDKNGKLSGLQVDTLKSNGAVKTSKYYIYNNKNKKLESTTTYKYYSNGVQKQITIKYTDGSTSVSKYNNKGRTTSHKYSNGQKGDAKYATAETYKYSKYKNGYPRKETCTRKTTSRGKTTTETSTTNKTFTFNKNKLITKETGSTVYKKGGKTTRTYSYSYSNTYNKKGYLTKSVYSSTDTDKSIGYKGTDKRTTTYKYKKVKVAKKYWKLYKNPQNGKGK